MSKTVFILGAGASKQAGAPLMWDFLDVADNLWKSGQVKGDEKHFERVFQQIGKLQAVHSKSQLDLINIESVFATLEMAKVLDKIPDGKVETIDECISSLRRLIVRTLEVTMKLLSSEGRVKPLPPYDEFVRLLKHLRDEANLKHSVSVLTFNYDMALDHAIHYNSLKLNYALEPSDFNAIPVLKLHGSLNWGKCRVCKEIIPWYLRDYFRKYSWGSLSLSSEPVVLDIGTKLKGFEHCGQKVMDEPVLVPPTWNKTEYHTALSLVWRQAAKELSEAENIFVIGYSLPESDAFFRYLYALGTVGEFPLQRFWVFDPDAKGGVKERFEALVGPGARSRFEKFDKRFDQAIGEIRSAFPARR